jgi:hypothetical protein
MKIKTAREEERLVHPVLWLVANRQLERAKAKPRGAQYDHTAAMVFAFHAYEAYINFIGTRLALEIWRKELDIPGGCNGKLHKVFDLCGLPQPDESEEPFRLRRPEGA